MSANEIISIILKTICFILLVFVIPLVKKKYSKDKLMEINDKIKTYVEAAEQVFGTDQGPEKKQWVCNKLLELGIDVNLDIIDAQIEAYVLMLHNALKA